MKQITTIFNTTKITINKYEKSDEAAILGHCGYGKLHVF